VVYELARLRGFVVDHRADQVHDPAAQAAVFQAWEQPSQFETFWRRDEFGHALGETIVHAAVGLFQPFVEVRHRRLQQLGGVIQLAGADAIGAALVLLDLLEGDPEGVGDWVWLRPIIFRRILSRAPTYRSTGWACSAAGRSFIRLKSLNAATRLKREY
jgi:hypothetical protein